ncbi:MAG: hypothetical protein ACEQR8_00185 [Cypionkella sp.]
MLRRTFLPALAAALLGWAGADAAPARAQTIDNVASATWSVGGQTVSVRSNPVTLRVEAAPPDTIAAFRRTGAAGELLAVGFARCGAVGGAAAASAGSAPPPSSMVPTTGVRAGEPFVVRVSAPAANRDPLAIEQVVVTITAGLDRETLTLEETAPASGVFAGLIATATGRSAIANDCRLDVSAGQTLHVAYDNGGGQGAALSLDLDVLADPFGLVFDSADGTPIDGVRVSLIDAASGAPARVFADDGVTPWPATLVSGQEVVDGAGNRHPTPPGEYRFPLAPLGSYRLVIEPPAPFTAPSRVPAGQLAGLLRPDGLPVVLVAASYGGVVTLTGPAPVRVDVPLDRPRSPLTFAKTVSQAIAAPGDSVLYTLTVRNPDGTTRRGVTVTDTASTGLRLQLDSVRIDGAAPAAGSLQADAAGRGFVLALGDLAPRAERRITYAMRVRPDVEAATLGNRAVLRDGQGNETRAGADLRIEREAISARMTILGRVTRGDCSIAAAREGIPGVRVMLEDGSFAVTDADGRYHFEGVVPGTHVVQAQAATLPGAGARFVDCTRSTSSAGSASSRFVSGQGGSLAVADFHAVAGDAGADEPARAAPLSDAAAAGAETDFLAAGDGPIDWLFPAVDHNPRAPAVRVAIRHRPGQKVELRVDGEPVTALAFDGARVDPAGTYAISVWRGIPLTGETTELAATVRGADGAVAAELARAVHFASTPARVEIVAQRSRLVADGASRPVLAVRVLDRAGRPVHAGISGEVAINAPYESAAALEAMQLRQLTGIGSASARWVVEGDDGIALVELAPTMVSGALRMRFAFADGEVRREQTLDAWVVPGEQKWTLVGLAEGALGSRTVADAMERGGAFDSDLGEHARVAFYAKGRVLGKTLLTVAYDSAKQAADQRLLGAIDPNAYYTVFADGSDRRFDAASRNKLYVRLESVAFYALYGDFEAGFDQTELARYLRTATGFKAEAQLGGLHAAAFAAETALRHRRDEFQGSGLSGPYRLSSRAIVPNSETVTLEVRDRFRSELVLERKALTRFVDYDIDLLAGTISFAQPIASRDFALNPQFVVIDFEADDAGERTVSAGARADWTTAGGALRVGATLLTDGGDTGRTELAAIDLRGRIDAGTEVRAEAGVSRRAGEQATAWLVEAEHHSDRLDVLAYARSLAPGYGVGQQSRAERGRRKFGADARLALAGGFSLSGSVWRDDALGGDAARRDAVQLRGDLRRGDTDARLGVTMFADRLSDGREANSTVLEGGVTQRLLDNRLELEAATSIALAGTESIDLPTRHRFSARYALTRWVKLIGTYEMAEGEAIDARTLRAGFELAPWAGARWVTTIGQETIAEQGKRSFAAFGLAQSWQLSAAWTLDASVDGNRVLSGLDAAQVINPRHPVASGGHLGEGGTLAEDFTAVSLGAGYRAGRWSAVARAEYRDGEFADRRGVTLGAIRQLGEGSVIGSGLTWTRANGADGSGSEVLDASLSAAWRPASLPWAVLAKLAYRADRIEGAVRGEAGFAGRSALLVDGDAAARRLVGSLSANWSPTGRDQGRLVQRTEIGLFLGGRYGFDRYGEQSFSGVTALAGLDARIGLGERVSLGASATVRSHVDDGATAFAIGPQVGFSPARNMLLTVGYNVTGFRDRDFAAARETRQGLFATIKLKLDSDVLGFLGIDR